MTQQQKPNPPEGRGRGGQPHANAASVSGALELGNTQQNGRVEHKHRHILNVARALRFQANLPIDFWGECVLTAGYLINQTPFMVLKGKMPHKLLHDKFSSKSRRCIFVGYPYGKKGWRVYDLELGVFLVSQDIVFSEMEFPYMDNSSHHLEPISSSINVDMCDDSVFENNDEVTTQINSRSEPLVAFESGAVVENSDVNQNEDVSESNNPNSYINSSQHDVDATVDVGLTDIECLPPEHISPLPAISRFLCTDSSEAPDSSDEPPSQDPYVATVARWRSRLAACPSLSSEFPIAPVTAPLGIRRRSTILIQPREAVPFGRPYRTHLNGPRKLLTARKRVGPLPARRLASRHASPRSSDHHSSSSSSSSDSSPVHSSGLDSSDQAHFGSSTRDVPPRLCYPPRRAPRHSTSQTPNANASEEKYEDAELIVVPSAVKNTEEKVETRKSSTNSKKEDILTEPQQEKEASSTDTSEDNPKILAFRRELETIALKHLGTVPENNSTSTPSVNSGSGTINNCELDPYDQLANSKFFTSLRHEFLMRLLMMKREEPKKNDSEALQDDSWVQAMQEELLQFKLQQVWVLVDLPHGMKIWWPKCTPRKRLIDYDVGRCPVARNEAIRDKKDIMLVQVYVDDIIFGSTKKSWCDEFEALMKSRFQMSSMCETAITPMETKVALTKDEEAVDVDDYGGSNLDRNPQQVLSNFLYKDLFSWQCKKNQTIELLLQREAEYVACSKICGQTATAKTLADGTLELHATIDTIVYTITEASIRNKLQLADASGITMLPNNEIFEGMGHMGYPTDGSFTFWKSFFTPQWRFLVHHILHCISSKSGGWDQFGSNIATALICLSTGRVYNFSKLIFDGMVANLKSKTKFLMYPRFLQMILDIQTENKHPYLAVTLTKKIFGNMKRGFRGVPRPLLPAMLSIVDPSAGQEAPSVTQPQPSSSVVPPTPPTTQPIPSEATTIPPLSQPAPPTPIAETTTASPSPSPSPAHEPMEHTFEQQSTDQQPPTPRQEATTSQLMTRIGDLEKQLKETKQTFGKAILTLVERVKTLEVALKRNTKRVLLSDSEEEETEPQGRKFHDLDPLVSLVQELVTPSKTVNALGEEQVEDISPTTLEAAAILTKVHKIKSVDKGKRYKRRKSSKEFAGTGLDFEEGNPLHLHPNDSNCASIVTVNLTRLNTIGSGLWDRCNAVVINWILTSLSQDVYLGHVFSDNAAKVWNELKETYDRIDGLIVFNLLQKINSFKQGSLLVSEYYHKLNSLWRENDVLTKLPDCTCEARNKVVDHGKLMKLMQFLMGLDDVYQPIRSSILTREILPEAQDVFVIISREESHMGIPASSSKIEKPHVFAFNSKTNDNNKRKGSGNWLTGNSSGNLSTGNNDKFSSPLSLSNEQMLKLMMSLVIVRQHQACNS
ncbi:ribonuclease H-like domain-containing protein [Tanacetum coccineum]|uniref:Ribonuclease H-like domain-containing protein n=1 Tax=Tanacetum coccineum TaxID=301880 RepID=A0ABQ5DK60_9ASTR